MDFNFYDRYKDHPTTELLKILKKPQDYQPAAIEAVTKILQERQVSETEVEQVNQYFGGIEATARLKEEKMTAYKEKVADFLEPVLQPQQTVDPRKWLNIFLLVVAIQYAWTLFGYISHVVRYIGYIVQCKKHGFNAGSNEVSWWDCAESRFDIMLLFELVNLAYIPLIFYLLIKRRRWGWILLFADNLFSLLGSLSQSYIFFAYQHIHNGDMLSFLFTILLRGCFAFFLWKKMIADHFDVSKPIKVKTVLVTAGIFIAFWGFLQLI